MRVSHLSLVFIGLAMVPAARAQNQAGTVKAVLQSGPDVGQRAPDFSLPWANRDGVGPVESPYQLASDRGKTVVVAFYPRDFTKSCTAQMRTLAEQAVILFGQGAHLGGAALGEIARVEGNHYGFASVTSELVRRFHRTYPVAIGPGQREVRR